MPKRQPSSMRLLRAARGIIARANWHERMRAGPGAAAERELTRRINIIDQSGLFDHDYYRSELHKRNLLSTTNNLVRHFEKTGDKLRISPHPLFDTHYYHEKYPDINQSGMSSLFHYITHGSFENRQPHPLFDTKYVRDQFNTKHEPLRLYLAAPPGKYSPHPLFDEKYVAEQMQTCGEKTENALIFFLRKGEEINPSRSFDCKSYREWYPDIHDLNAFYHYIRWGQAEGRTIISGAMSITKVAAEIDAIASLDSDLLAPHTNIHRIPRVNRIDAISTEQALLHKLVNANSSAGILGVLFLPSLARGGAEKVSANLINALLSNDDDIKLIVFLTDSGDTGSAPWFCEDKRLTVCDIHREIIAVGPSDAAAQVIAIYLQLVAPKFVFINNSRIGWLIAEQHGRAIRSFSRLIAAVFCYDFDQYGRRGGYAWTHLCHSIHLLDRVITDNISFSLLLSSELRLSPEKSKKLTPLYQPIEVSKSVKIPDVVQLGDPTRTKLAVLWASRFAHQKRVFLGLEVARLLPQVRFVFAGGTKDDLGKSGLRAPPNAEFIGVFDSFNHLQQSGCSIFLYTSQYDGLPNVLLEAAAAGMAIVAPNVGGINELVTDRTGWLISDHVSPHAYAEAIHEMISCPAEVEQRKQAMFDLLLRQHSHSRYARAVRDILLLKSES